MVESLGMPLDIPAPGAFCLALPRGCRLTMPTSSAAAVAMNRRTRFEAPNRASSWTLLARNSKFRPALMAEAAGISAAHLRRLCRDLFGESLSQWLRRERMVAARLLLAETESVKVTQDHLGYEHRSQLARDFRNAYGVTPSSWVRRFKTRTGG
jgi:AraC-like DNA-binding protein